METYPSSGVLCPNCLKELADCIEYNDGWKKCKSPKLQYACPTCFTSYDVGSKPNCNCKKE